MRGGFNQRRRGPVLARTEAARADLEGLADLLVATRVSQHRALTGTDALSVGVVTSMARRRRTLPLVEHADPVLFVGSRG